MIIANNNSITETDVVVGDKKFDSDFIESEVKVIEMDGHVFRVKKVFAKEGRTILENVVSMLLDKMDQQDKLHAHN